MKLKANLIIDIIKNQIEREGVPFYLEKRGDKDAGAIFIKHDLMNGFIHVYHRVYNSLGEKKFQFFDVFDEDSIGKFFKKQKAFDSDLWIIEIEARNYELKKLFSKLGL